MLIDATAGGRPPEARRARLATATLFCANGCGLGSRLPHIPDVKIWHDLSEGVLLAIAGGAIASLPVALGLVAGTVSLVVLGVAALQRQTVRAAALAG
jgi:hypothetical protein